MLYLLHLSNAFKVFRIVLWQNESDKGASVQQSDRYTTFVSCREQVIACGTKKLRTLYVRFGCNVTDNS